MDQPTFEGITRLFKTLSATKVARPFKDPVETVIAAFPTYTDHIKQPLDLGKIKAKIGSQVSECTYTSLAEFVADVDLVCSNARTFCPTVGVGPTDGVHAGAIALQQKLHEMLPEIETTIEVGRQGVSLKQLQEWTRVKRVTRSRTGASPRRSAAAPKTPRGEKTMPKAKPRTPKAKPKTPKTPKPKSAKTTKGKTTPKAKPLKVKVKATKPKPKPKTKPKTKPEHAPPAVRAPRLVISAKKLRGKQPAAAPPVPAPRKPRPTVAQLAPPATPRTMTMKDKVLCRDILSSLMTSTRAQLYLDPVEAVPMYDRVIKRRMHLRLVEANLAKSSYTTIQGWANDIETVFMNAIIFNIRHPKDQVVTYAVCLLDKFQQMYHNKLRGPVPSRVCFDGANACRDAVVHVCSQSRNRGQVFVSFSFLHPFAYYYVGIEGEAEHVAEYRRLISSPMHLLLVLENVFRGRYLCASDVINDVHLVFDNCLTYWKGRGNSDLQNDAVSLRNKFDNFLRQKGVRAPELKRARTKSDAAAAAAGAAAGAAPAAAATASHGAGAAAAHGAPRLAPAAGGGGTLTGRKRARSPGGGRSAAARRASPGRSLSAPGAAGASAVGGAKPAPFRSRWPNVVGAQRVVSVMRQTAASVLTEARSSSMWPFAYSVDKASHTAYTASLKSLGERHIDLDVVEVRLKKSQFPAEADFVAAIHKVLFLSEVLQSNEHIFADAVSTKLHEQLRETFTASCLEQRISTTSTSVLAGTKRPRGSPSSASTPGRGTPKRARKASPPAPGSSINTGAGAGASASASAGPGASAGGKGRVSGAKARRTGKAGAGAAPASKGGKGRRKSGKSPKPAHPVLLLDDDDSDEDDQPGAPVAIPKWPGAAIDSRVASATGAGTAATGAGAGTGASAAAGAASASATSGVKLKLKLSFGKHAAGTSKPGAAGSKKASAAKKTPAKKSPATPNRVGRQRSMTRTKLSPSLLACRRTLLKVKKHAFARMFLAPVVKMHPELETQYLAKITDPVDLGLITRRLSHGAYTCVDDFKKDMAKMFQNCFTFNAADTLATNNIKATARHLQWFFEHTLVEQLAGIPQGDFATPEEAAAASKALSQQRDSLMKQLQTAPFAPAFEVYQQLYTDIFERKSKKARPFILPVVDLVPPQVALAYRAKIKQPMELSTVKRKMEAGVYEAGNDFVADVHLVFDNAMTFNAPETEFHINAADFKRTFDVKLRDKALDIMDRVLQAAVTGIATPMPSASMPPPPHRTASTPLATIHAMAGTKSVRQASRVAAAALSASAAEAISGNTDDDDSDADVDMGRSPPPPRHSGKRPRHSGKRPRITLSLGGKRPRSARAAPAPPATLRRASSKAWGLDVITQAKVKLQVQVEEARLNSLQREKEREDARHRNQAMEDRQRRTERHLEIEADISAHVDLLTASLHSQALQRQQLFHKVARSHLGPVGSNPPPLPPPTHTRAAVHTPSAAGASGVNTAHAGASGSTGTEPGPPPVPPPPTSEAGPAITAGTITQTGASTAPLAPHTPSPVPAMTTPATAAAPAAEAAAVAVSQRPPFKPMRIGEHRVTRRPWRQQPPRLASALSLRPPAVFLQDGQAEDKDQDKGKGKEKDSTGSGLGSATAGGEGGRDGHEAWSRRVEAWQAARTCGTIMGGRSCDTRDAAAQVKGASTSGAACGTDIPRTPAGGAPSTSASASASTPTLLVLAEWCYAWKDDEQVSVRATSSSAAHGASLKAWAGRAEQEEEAEGDGGEEEEEEEGCGGGGGVSQTRRDEKNSSSLLLGAALDTWPASGSSTEDVDVNEAALHKLRHQTAMALLTHGCGTRMTRVDVGALAANQLQDMLRLNPAAHALAHAKIQPRPVSAVVLTQSVPGVPFAVRHVVIQLPVVSVSNASSAMGSVNAVSFAVACANKGHSEVATTAYTRSHMERFRSASVVRSGTHGLQRLFRRHTFTFDTQSHCFVSLPQVIRSTRGCYVEVNCLHMRASPVVITINGTEVLRHDAVKKGDLR